MIHFFRLSSQAIRRMAYGICAVAISSSQAIRRMAYGICAIIACLPAPKVFATPGSCIVESIKITGLHKTNEAWFLNYLSLELAAQMDEAQAELVRKHIMTTDIYTDAYVLLNATDATHCELAIDVTEKWTTIPVVRGAYGGGTPLAVVGGYETNAFGKLYLIGGEVRRYGTMAPGFFLYGKSPRAWQGRGSLGGELWLDRRRRAFFDDDGKVNGYADSEAWTFKYELLYPIGDRYADGRSLQVGAHLDVVRENPTSFKDKNMDPGDSLAPTDITIPTKTSSSAALMPMIAYDHLNVDKIQMDGVRGLAKMGGQSADEKFSSIAESEIFWYERLPHQVNLAVHGFAGSQGSNTLRNMYFLGGFDSVRGLPDGVHYGKKMIYGNAELRWLGFESKYLHAQSALFVDHGSAFSESRDAFAHRESAMGAGVRLSIPQIYRLLLRIDYGWSIGNTKSHGLSVGFGQFFQPYKLFF